MCIGEYWYILFPVLNGGNAEGISIFWMDNMMMLRLFEAIPRYHKLIKAGSQIRRIFGDGVYSASVLYLMIWNHTWISYQGFLRRTKSQSFSRQWTMRLLNILSMLCCLEDGSIELSSNACEWQIRRIARYRNNSYFVGGQEEGCVLSA